MKYFLVVVLFLTAVFTAQKLEAQNKKFGLGVIVGEPTGLSAKLWLSHVNALVFGLGWSVEGYRVNGFDPDYDRVTRIGFHVDYIWHSYDAIAANGQFPLYYGIGGRINTGPPYAGTFAVRGVLGIEWLPHSTPLDIFLEIVPTLQLVSSTGFGLDAGFGARYFF